jgi:hypothetical protein
MMDLHDALEPLATRVPVEDRLDDIVFGRSVVRLHTPTRRPRKPILVAASIVMVVGAGALIASRFVAPTDAPPADASPATAVPAGVPEPLFMLPGDSTEGLTGFQIASGSVSADGPISLVGVDDGNGYRDLFTITVFDHPIDRKIGIIQPGVEWAPVDLTTGPAEILQGASPITSVIQQRGTYWLRVDALPAEATRAMEAAVVSSDGTLALTADDLTILTTQPADTTPLVTAWFQTADGIHVETATATSTFDVNTTASLARPTTIRNHPGWQLTQTTSDGTSTLAIAWMETPERKVIVYGDATIDQLLAVAEDLTVVDYATWAKNIPAATTTEDPTSTAL